MFLYVSPTFSVQFFDELAAHISSCIRSYRQSLNRSQRKALLEELFMVCDQAKVNFNIWYMSLSLACMQCSEKEDLTLFF